MVDVSHVRIGPEDFEGLLGMPANPTGLVLFSHGSGSGRFSPRNNYVAEGLRKRGFATLLLDLLKPGEENDRVKVFDIPLLASRLIAATRWARSRPQLVGLNVGFFGASTGAGAALVAAAEMKHAVSAVVSRGGRPDLAGAALEEVRCPTLLIVGGADHGVLELNETALARLSCARELTIVPGAGHLFEEPGTLEAVLQHATNWFLRYLRPGASRIHDRFSDRRDAGRQLASALEHLRDENPVILALPRGGVPVGFEVAQALHAPLQIVLVRKIGAPGQPELGLGAVVDGQPPQIVLNDELVKLVQPGEDYLQDEERRQVAEIERRRALYGISGLADIAGQTAIIVDDGIATGGTVKAVLQALRRRAHRRLVLAVPVAPPDSLQDLAPLADEIVCLQTPEPFYAVGAHYRDFTQTTDAEVVELLRQ